MKTMLILWLVSCVSVFARIGETVMECKARYGEPTRQGDFRGVPYMIFVRSGFEVMICFQDGLAGSISFRRADAGAKVSRMLPENVIAGLLAANSAGGKWATNGPDSKSPHAWIIQERDLYAECTGGTLTISTRQMIEKTNLKKAEEQRAALQEFQAVKKLAGE
jgi:hypothetical protein